ERTCEFKKPAERHGQIGGAGPAVDIAVEAPILPAVVAPYAGDQFLAEKLVAPRDSRSVGRLAGRFACRGAAVALIPGIFAGHGVENSALERQLRPFGELGSMLDANLRRPCPEIAGVGQRWNRDSGERSGSERREE